MHAQTYLFAAVRPELQFQKFTESTLQFATNASVVKLRPKRMDSHKKGGRSHDGSGDLEEHTLFGDENKLPSLQEKMGLLHDCVAGRRSLSARHQARLRKLLVSKATKQIMPPAAAEALLSLVGGKQSLAAGIEGAESKGAALASGSSTLCGAAILRTLRHALLSAQSSLPQTEFHNHRHRNHHQNISNHKQHFMTSSSSAKMHVRPHVSLLEPSSIHQSAYHLSEELRANTLTLAQKQEAVTRVESMFETALKVMQAKDAKRIRRGSMLTTALAKRDNAVFKQDSRNISVARAIMLCSNKSSLHAVLTREAQGRDGLFAGVSGAVDDYDSGNDGESSSSSSSSEDEEVYAYSSSDPDDEGGHHHRKKKQARIADDLSADELAEFKKSFDMYDSDKNGTITIEELGSVLESLDGQAVTNVRLHAMIDEVDVNRDGEIDFQEFSLMMTRKKQQVKDEEGKSEEVLFEDDAFSCHTAVALCITLLGDIAKLLAAAKVGGGGASKEEKESWAAEKKSWDAEKLLLEEEVATLRAENKSTMVATQKEKATLLGEFKDALEHAKDDADHHLHDVEAKAKANQAKEVDALRKQHAAALESMEEERQRERDEWRERSSKELAEAVAACERRSAAALADQEAKGRAEAAAQRRDHDTRLAELRAKHTEALRVQRDEIQKTNNAKVTKAREEEKHHGDEVAASLRERAAAAETRHAEESAALRERVRATREACDKEVAAEKQARHEEVDALRLKMVAQQKRYAGMAAKVAGRAWKSTTKVRSAGRASARQKDQLVEQSRQAHDALQVSVQRTCVVHWFCFDTVR